MDCMYNECMLDSTKKSSIRFFLFIVKKISNYLFFIKINNNFVALERSTYLNHTQNNAINYV